MNIESLSDKELLNKSKSLKDEISSLNTKQNALKVLLNALFGACGNEYFLYFNNNVAEGITSTGQYIIKTVEREINRYLNELLGTKNKDYIIASDTDSLFLELEDIVEKYFPNKSKEDTVKLLDKICKEKITEIINNCCSRLAEKTNAYEKKIFFKRETISDAAIWVAKKRYVLNVYNKEGVTYAEPKLKIMGLEIVRSSTPAIVRKTLKEAVKIAISKDEESLQKFIAEEKKRFYNYSSIEIAFPRGVNNLSKYSCSSAIYSKGCPIHVRGSLLFNHYLKEYNLESIYPFIKEGEKIKFLYLKKPNTIRENCISFVENIPKEFDLEKYVDYDMMFQKSFLEPLGNIIDGLGWSVEHKISLEDLFS